jgi:hypothetical protein
MRIIIAFISLAASLTLGGCFHHSQQVYTEDLPPPPATTPIK